MENNDGAKQQSVARLADRLRPLKAMLQQISERTELICKIENAISLMTSDFICDTSLPSRPAGPDGNEVKRRRAAGAGVLSP